ncbi:alpha/beta fold hydrolase [Streptomyces sp. TE5632]
MREPSATDGGAWRIDRCHVVGHSVGGPTALLLTEGHPGGVADLTGIEGNVAPEDCFLSRQIVTHSHDDPDELLARFAERVAGHASTGALYASGLPHKVRAGAVGAVFESMVDLSDHGKLLYRSLGLPVPKMFMHGEQNNTPSCLPALAEGGVELAEVEHRAHFPMSSDPPQMWARIADLVSRADSRS